MAPTETLATLKKSGKPQTATIYKRHGAGDNVFGALTSEIDKLRKKIKVDHAPPVTRGQMAVFLAVALGLLFPN